MLHYAVCGCSDSTRFKGDEVTLHQMCYDCKKLFLGQEIAFLRFGDAPESGQSYNYATNSYEDGLSVYMIADGQLCNTIRCEFTDRKIYAGKGMLIGFGGDDEALVKNFKMRKATKSKLTKLGVSS